MAFGSPAVTGTHCLRRPRRGNQPRLRVGPVMECFPCDETRHERRTVAVIAAAAFALPRPVSFDAAAAVATPTKVENPPDPASLRGTRMAKRRGWDSNPRRTAKPLTVFKVCGRWPLRSPKPFLGRLGSLTSAQVGSNGQNFGQKSRLVRERSPRRVTSPPVSSRVRCRLEAAATSVAAPPRPTGRRRELGVARLAQLQ